MAVYPIKLLKDESGQPFVPLTSVEAIYGDKNLQYILNVTQVSNGHFKVECKGLTLKDATNSAIAVRWPGITTVVKPSYLQLNDEAEKAIYAPDGANYLDLEDSTDAVNFVAYDGSKWVLIGNASTGSGGHVITDGEGNTMEQQKILNFVGFNVENDNTNRATKVINPTPINNLNTTTSGQGPLDAYQGHVLNDKFNNYLPKTGTAESSKGLIPKGIVGSDAANSAGWYKVCSQTMSGYGNTNILYYIKDGYNSGMAGLLELEMRSSNNNIGMWQCYWLFRAGFAPGDIRIVINDMTWTLYVKRSTNQYGRISFTEIYNRNITGDGPSYSMTYYNSTAPETTEPEGIASYDSTSQILANVYPVGSIYLSVNNVSPSKYLGGKWELIEDKFLVGAGNIYAGGATGGSMTHTHPLSDNGYAKSSMHGDGVIRHRELSGLPTWQPNYKIQATSGTSESGFNDPYGIGLGGSTDSAYNIPPYLAVYMWVRTA